MNIRRTQIGRRLDAVCHDSRRAPGRRRKHRLRIIRIHIDVAGFLSLRLPGRRYIFEKQRFCRRIIVHRLVIIQMVFRQIRERRVIKFHARHAPHRKSVRRDLHAAMRDAVLFHFPKRPLQIHHIRRCIVRSVFPFPNQCMNRPDDARLMPARFQNMRNDMRECRLPIRPRHSDHAHGARRMIEEIRRDVLHRSARIGHIDHRHTRRRFDFLLRHNDRRPGFRRRFRKIMRIDMGADETNKKAARFDRTRIRRDIGNGNIRIAANFLIRRQRQQFPKLFHIVISFLFIYIIYL